MPEASRRETYEKVMQIREEQNLGHKKIAEKIDEDISKWTIAGWIYRGYEPRENGKVTVECDWCGEEFERYRSQVEEHTFCSDECFNEWLSNRTGEDNPNYDRKEVECDWCGRTFEKVPSHIYDHNFCCAECYHQWYEEEGVIEGENNPNWVGGEVEVECVQCGKSIMRKKAEVEEHERHFCSDDCKKAWFSDYMRGENSPNYNPDAHKEVECQECGKIFEKRADRADGNNFCSEECYYKWWRGAGPFRGMNWEEQRKKALERDNHICQLCGAEEDGRKHDVHHIIPFRKFGLENYEEANQLSNLLTLCRDCHLRVERVEWGN